ncbi:glycosyltransferase family 4 protein [Thermococcus sp.]|uniref:glycosyltransferase family 4 protein n=1 Tax=Thermococcus sp. TaxID=35749 RepID=UPI002618C4CF|nr:glycosyltransferase family 4 protein [Thermococcus sp.]
MKIIMIGWYKPQIGGGSHVIQNIVHQLKDSHEIYVINMEEKGLPYLGHWNDNGVEVFQERIYSNLYSSIQTMFQTTKRAILLKRKIKPDIYHVHSPFFAGIGFLDRKTPMVLTMHGYPSLETVAMGRIRPDSVQFNLIRKLEIESAKRADAVIAVGKDIYRWITTCLEIDPSKVFYLPNGVDSYKFVRIHKNTNTDEIMGFPLIGYIKGLSKVNGPDIAVHSMKHVVRYYPYAKLVLIGDGPMKSELKSLVQHLKLEKNVLFIGRVTHEEIPFYLSTIDVLIVPSRSETAGLTMLEGMASKKVVIVSSVGGLKETWLDSGGKTIIMFRKEDPVDLADKISYVLENRKLQRKLSHNARKYVVYKRSWEVYAEKLLDIYEYAIRSRKGKGI